MKTNSEPICNESNFIGNRRETCLDLVGYDGKTLREKFLVGDPRDCHVGSAAEMKQEGFVGIYSKPLKFSKAVPRTNGKSKIQYSRDF
jgi:hypothetical protein